MSPPQAKNFENFAHFRVLRSNLAKSLTTGRPFWGGGGGSGQNFGGGGGGGGGAKTYFGPPTQILGGGGAMAPWPPPPVPPPLVVTRVSLSSRNNAILKVEMAEVGRI